MAFFSACVFHHPVWLFGDCLVSVFVYSIPAGRVDRGALGGGTKVTPGGGSEGSCRGRTFFRDDPAAPCGLLSRRDF